jgi:hypothetical protein
MPNDKLSPQLVTPPPRKKWWITFGSMDNDLKEDEKKTCSNDIRGKGGEEFEATTTQGGIEEEPKPNLDQVIDNIQVEPVVSAEPVVSIIELVAIATESFQPVQIEIEHL